MDKERAKDIIAYRCAQELKDGYVVNLGIGIPTRCARFFPRMLTSRFMLNWDWWGKARLLLLKQLILCISWTPPAVLPQYSRGRNRRFCYQLRPDSRRSCGRLCIRRFRSRRRR